MNSYGDIKKTITHEYLKDNYDYIETGFLSYKTKSKNGRIGILKGNVAYDGYLRVSIKNTNMSYHRMIWLWHHKTLPKYIDHINRIKSDNRIENLRETTTSQNMANVEKFKKNPSCVYKGVSFHKKHKRYIAHINYMGKLIHIGYFLDPKDAAKAYDEKAKSLWGEFACTNF